jgi:hypothetical protein
VCESKNRTDAITHHSYRKQKKYLYFFISAVYYNKKKIIKIILGGRDFFEGTDPKIRNCIRIQHSGLAEGTESYSWLIFIFFYFHCLLLCYPAQRGLQKV